MSLKTNSFLILTFDSVIFNNVLTNNNKNEVNQQAKNFLYQD